MTFRDRMDAGRQLGAVLEGWAGRKDVLILALPRGGVPVGFEVARRLRAPLDIFVVGKLGVPSHEELAMGAIASGGVRVLNLDVIYGMKIPDEVVDAVEERELTELARREREYRGARPPLAVRDRAVILVDDGLATGATMRAAVAALRRLGPACVIVAVPIASPETCEQLRAEADEVVCLMMPASFFAVGEGYEDFSQVTDDEVRGLLQRAVCGHALVA